MNKSFLGILVLIGIIVIIVIISGKYYSDTEESYFQLTKKTMNESQSESVGQDLKNQLTPLQFAVTQRDDTEPPFRNAYWDNHQDGIYVDIVDGTPLFSSKDKYDSGTGWPSFTKPLSGEAIITRSDTNLVFSRTEVRSKKANSHLGHVFNDGPKDKGGLRYCMNSAALKFISKEDLKSGGYSEYSKLLGK